MKLLKKSDKNVGKVTIMSEKAIKNVEKSDKNVKKSDKHFEKSDQNVGGKNPQKRQIKNF